MIAAKSEIAEFIPPEPGNSSKGDARKTLWVAIFGHFPTLNN
jgi:hypothetical protein